MIRAGLVERLRSSVAHRRQPLRVGSALIIKTTEGVPHSQRSGATSTSYPRGYPLLLSRREPSVVQQARKSRLLVRQLLPVAIADKLEELTLTNQRLILPGLSSALFCPGVIGAGIFCGHRHGLATVAKEGGSPVELHALICQGDE